MAGTDALREYRRKRDFKQTAEPAGDANAANGDTSAGLSFVVQKHSARTLHYDFRLELGGVLLSWAVPKGPSLDPAVKRLAMQTEDHPLEYGSFEGVIPKGHYGAGNVIVWDRGTWQPTDDATKQYQAGHLEFLLHGEKLRGKWHLIRRGDDKRWLLFKSRDAEARTGEQAAVTTAEPNSVLSGRSVKQTRRTASPAQAAEAAATLAIHASARRADLPKLVSPQLATLVKTAPDDDSWLHEVKLDGYRVQLRVQDGEARAVTRGGKDWTERLRSLSRAAAALQVKSVLIDGEACVLRRDGTTDFQALQNSLKSDADDSLVYFAFDLLFLDGWDLRRVPLVDRKSLLQRLLLGADSRLRYNDHVKGSGKRFFDEACQRHLEGIVCKRAHATYVSKRTADWLKVKCSKRQEMVIGGFTKPRGSRSYFGALLVGAFDAQGELVYRGKVGSGFTEQSLRDLHTRLTALREDRSPFLDMPNKALARQASWVSPVLLAEVEFTEMTSDGLLRHPTFKGLREDKPASEVKMEEPQVIPDPTRSQVRLTNPDRVLYPDQGVTKRDLAQYYVEAAQWMLPHVAGRILTLVRCPQGQKQKCFYQKHLSAGMPQAIGPVSVREKNKSVEYMTIHDAVGLLSLVQFGVLEIHVWGAHADRPDRPDQLVFDLDPAPEMGWTEIIAGAQTVRRRLADIGLESFVKTTGGKGLHVVVPVERRLDWETAKAFCRAVADDITAREPDKYVATMSKERRRGRIFIDYLRNGRGATSVCAYSTRARPGALVATPLAWDELDSELRPEQFTIASVAERLAKQGDKAWERYFKVRQSVTKAMRQSLGMKE